MEYHQAEWYDAIARDYWHMVEPELRSVLAPWEGESALAVDLGAGTGLTTVTLAQMCAGEILACEPEREMRVGLMSKVTACDSLCQRVTVLPWAASDLCAQLAEPVGVVTAIAMLDHLSPDSRAQLFAWTARNLTDTGALIIGPFYSDTDEDLTAGGPSVDSIAEPAPHTVNATDPHLGDCYAQTSVGRLRYSGWARLDPGDDRDCWQMTWQVHQGENLLAQRESVFRVYPATPEELIAEAHAAGLTATRQGHFLLLKRS
ncbi:methyltransferase domain-containing protein [Corynebacterium sp. 3HC-13]|uniref:methyltransferase domain-containing protein n=1 Tax=Corynebacterium poyangense TaxID=2684405 RepID=UPI001CCDFCCA|nr:class I SAM-dependent methyltransferase [Corynebacterium poyangense]MBZ8176590.1 methyltransferase domain-containing protein [Corynebacterium poyangense]